LRSGARAGDQHHGTGGQNTASRDLPHGHYLRGGGARPTAGRPYRKSNPQLQSPSSLIRAFCRPARPQAATVSRLWGARFCVRQETFHLSPQHKIPRPAHRGRLQGDHRHVAQARHHALDRPRRQRHPRPPLLPAQLRVRGHRGTARHGMMPTVHHFSVVHPKHNHV